MRVARYYAADDIRLEDVADPGAGAGELVVELAACGVCGTDLMDWYTRTKAPAVLGHEPVGVVVGDGRRVFVHHHVPCFVCEQCRAGRHTLCPEFRRAGLRPGAFAERFTVAADNVRLDLLTIPEHLSDDAATLIEPLACVLRGQHKAGVGPGTRLLVMGLGQVGLLQVQAGLAAGAEVIGADPLADRRDRCAPYGARAIGPDQVDDLAGWPSVTIVCTSAAAAVTQALAISAPGGIVQLFAPAGPDEPFPIDSASLFFREVTIQFTYSAGPFDTREALDLLAGGQVTDEGITTHHFPLERLADAMAMARTPEAVRVVVTGPAYRSGR